MVARIKVAHLINSLKPGGAERFVVDLVKHIPRNDFETQIFCLYEKGDWARELEDLGISVKVIGVPRKFGFKGYRRVHEAICHYDFDILHCHLFESCWYGLPTGWLIRIPIRIAHLQNCYWHVSLKLRLWDRFIFQFADAAFGCSRAVLSFYTERMWYPAAKLHLVYNGVDITRFEGLPSKEEARRQLGITDDRVIVTTVASLTPQKGHEYLLQAARMIISRCRSVRFWFVGEGGLRATLEARTRTLGLEPWVQFWGKRMDVPILLKASDIFVLPSLWEGLPLVLVEAGLAGIPVVASRVDGIVEVVRDGRNGLLVPPKDPPSLAETCLTLIEDPQLRERMGTEGRIMTLTRFDIRQIACQVANIYRTLLERKQR